MMPLADLTLDIDLPTQDLLETIRLFPSIPGNLDTLFFDAVAHARLDVYTALWARWGEWADEALLLRVLVLHLMGAQTNDPVQTARHKNAAWNMILTSKHTDEVWRRTANRMDERDDHGDAAWAWLLAEAQSDDPKRHNVVQRFHMKLRPESLRNRRKGTRRLTPEGLLLFVERHLNDPLTAHRPQDAFDNPSHPFGVFCVMMAGGTIEQVRKLTGRTIMDMGIDSWFQTHFGHNVPQSQHDLLAWKRQHVLTDEMRQATFHKGLSLL